MDDDFEFLNIDLCLISLKKWVTGHEKILKLILRKKVELHKLYDIMYSCIIEFMLRFFRLRYFLLRFFSFAMFMLRFFFLRYFLLRFFL